jgi:hypothetical protein
MKANEKKVTEYEAAFLNSKKELGTDDGTVEVIISQG